MILDHLHAYVLLLLHIISIYIFTNIYPFIIISISIVMNLITYHISSFIFCTKQFSMEKGQVIKLTHLGRIKQCKSMVSLRISGTNQRTKFGLVSYQ